jgi:PhnB protein
MSIKALNPYLTFNGTADKAIKLYETALGAKTEHLQRFSDAPGMKLLPEHKSRVMHALLRLGPGTLMISDSMPDHPFALKGNVHVCLDFSDATAMTRQFDALAAGGEVTMALHDTFWGARFGMLTDAFGVRWMFNCDLKGARS